MGSRLERIRSQRAGKQGVWYLSIALVLGIVTLFWGLPALARFAGGLISPSKDSLTTYELKPTPPIISDVPEATNSATITVGGYAQPGIEVGLYVNGAMLGRKLVTESGTFNFQHVNVVDGENRVYTYAYTTGGLQSEQSKEYTIVLDATKPTITIDSPKEGDVMRGNTQRIVNFVGGVSEEGCKVYIGERMAILDTEGKFSLPFQLVEGDQQILVKAVDKAGNETVQEVKVRWEP